MTEFSTKYFTMKEADALRYAKAVLDIFDEHADLSCKEIGDGNLNYVFRILDNRTGKSIIIKQAGPVARISDEFKVSTDRNRIEYEALKVQNKLAPGLVPKIYGYDPVMNCCVMEDLSEYVLLRAALIAHQRYPLFADHITTFLVQTLLLTSDVVLNHKEKKELVKVFINPDLCEITEDLVYTEPFYDCPRNDILELTRDFAEKEFWSDEALLLETAKLKFEFMTNAQSLVHGDLHTGSIFVKADGTKVIDPEFAFYGPAGYDVGNIVANFIFAYANAEATITDSREKAEYKGWLEETIVQIIDRFSEKFRAAWDVHAKERTARYKGFKELFLGGILRDASAVAGLELSRRMIGIAGVKDIAVIPDAHKRAQAERFALIAGKRFILERDRIRTGKQFLSIVKESEDKVLKP